MVSLNLTQTHVTEWALVCWQPCDKSWSSWLREASVSSSRLCCLLRAWQFLGWKRGKGGHQVKSCKDKSYCPGVRLIPSCKLQTYTFKNFLEKNPEKPWNKYSENSWWTEMFLNDLELLVLVSSSLPDPRSSKLQLQATVYPCISWQNHCNALSWQWVFCFHKSLCLFFFFLMCKGTENLWKVLLGALLQLWHMTPHRDFDVTTLLFSSWYWCIYSKNKIPYCFFLGFLKPKSQAHVIQDLLFVWFPVFSSWLLLTRSCWSDHLDSILPVLIWSNW